MNRRLRILLALSATMMAACLGSRTEVRADPVFTFEPVGLPSWSDVVAHDVNNTGRVVGIYGATARRGFLGQGDTYLTLNVPGTEQTYAQGLNDDGQVVGYSFGADGYLGFVLQDGAYSTLVVPGAAGTFAQGINNGGQVAGYFQDDSGTHGFIGQGGTYTTIDVPGASSTFLRGINDNGHVAGYYVDGSGTHGFILQGGAFRTLDVPGAAVTQAYGINNLGEVVGWYSDALNSSDAHGFLWRGGTTFDTIDVPGAILTEALGINDAGQVVGYDVPGAGQSGRGFLATPAVPEPSSFAMTGGALALLGVLAWRRSGGRGGSRGTPAGS